MLPLANELYEEYLYKYCKAKNIQRQVAETHEIVKLVKDTYENYTEYDLAGCKGVPDYSKRNLDE